MGTLVCHWFQGSGGGKWEPQARVKLNFQSLGCPSCEALVGMAVIISLSEWNH